MQLEVQIKHSWAAPLQYEIQALICIFKYLFMFWNWVRNVNFKQSLFVEMRGHVELVSLYIKRWLIFFLSRL